MNTFSDFMEMQYVESSVIRRIGYDEDHELLRVEFVSGAVYDYFNVPWIVADQFLSAPSRGSFYNDLIRDVYEFQKSGLRKSA